MRPCDLDAVLFDFGGVIAEEGFAQGVQALASAHGRDPREIWTAGLNAVWDSGYVFGKGTEADFWTLFKARTGLEGDEAAWREDILARFVVRPWMLALADELRRAGVVTAILSDQTDWLARMDARLGFSRHFDQVFNSFDHAMSKRDPAFFRFALERLGVAAPRTLFIDDNLGNVERARALGLHGVLYQDRPDLERALARLCPEALAP